MEPTSEEDLAIQLLKKAARHWPDSLWLFTASGMLCVMRKGPDGERVMLHDRRIHDEGGVDPDYVLDTIDIESDGGDW
jgi:hypothetical protein